MGLRINTNVLALKAQNKLKGTTVKLGGALERLSSGLRINKGSDDVVGLLKSESLRSQIRGIEAVELNLSNAQSLLGIAEGSLSQLTDIAQKIREKVVVAADSTISSSDRSNINTAVTDLVSEFSRLAAASEFDGVKLLTGTFTSKSFQVGPNATDTLSFSISDTRTSQIGKVAVLTAQTLTNISASTAAAAFADPAGIRVNGVTIAATAFTSDGVSSVQASESAIAYVNAINNYSGESGVTAVTLANVVTISYNGGGQVSNADGITINGVSLAQANYSSDDAGATSLATAINNVSTQTGVSATVDSTNNKLLLTASDGRNINIGMTGVASGSDLFGHFSVSEAGAVNYLYRGTFKLVKDDAFTVLGANAEFAASDTVSVSVSTSTTLSQLDVNSSTNAQDGIFIMDQVIKQLQTRRTDVGSKTIRMELAQSELAVRKENLAGAESVIRDADVAIETANLTAAQILQQAGASVLSRANAVPQIALSLLQS